MLLELAIITPPPTATPSLSNCTRTNLIFPAISRVCYQHISIYSETSMNDFTSLSFRNTLNKDLNQQTVCQLNARTMQRNLPSTVWPGCGLIVVGTSVIICVNPTWIWQTLAHTWYMKMAFWSWSTGLRITEASHILSRTWATIPFPSNALDHLSISSKDLEKISSGLQDARYTVQTSSAPISSLHFLAVVFYTGFHQTVLQFGHPRD